MFLILYKVDKMRQKKDAMDEVMCNQCNRLAGWLLVIAAGDVVGHFV